MKKNFDIKALKSSNYCGKFSKSVSQETLVIGATTIGRDIKQTRRLIKGCADKPLDAVGTFSAFLNAEKVMEKLLRHVITRRTLVRRGYLPEQGTHANKESLFASVTCFMRLPRRIQRMLLVMTFPVLAIFFTIAIITESRAEDCINSSSQKVTCIDKLTDENGNNSCGTNCTFRVVEENGKQVLHVYKKDISKPASIRTGAFSPYYYADNQVLDANGNVLPLNNIVLDNDFESLGLYLFSDSGAQISSASGKFVFNNGQLYFAGGRTNKTTLDGDVIFNNSVKQAVEATRINGDVIISDNVTDITMWSFESTEINGNLVIPDTIQSVGQHAFRNLSITGQIYCASGIENCYNMIKDGCKEREDCLTSLENLLNSKKFSAYPDGCEKLEANLKCTKCKSASFKLEDDGWCLRKIYTPAEAAEVLRDDNTNEVTITFRK